MRLRVASEAGAQRSTSHPFAETCSRPPSRNSATIEVPPQGPIKSREALLRLSSQSRESRSFASGWSCMMVESNSFMAMEAPGFATRRNSKTIRPNSETVRYCATLAHHIWSKTPSGKGNARTSPTRACTVEGKAPAWIATSTDATFSGARSSAVTDPFGPTSSHSTDKNPPLPHPASSTVSPARMPTWRTAASYSGRALSKCVSSHRAALRSWPVDVTFAPVNDRLRACEAWDRPPLCDFWTICAPSANMTQIVDRYARKCLRNSRTSKAV